MGENKTLWSDTSAVIVANTDVKKKTWLCDWEADFTVKVENGSSTFSSRRWCRIKSRQAVWADNGFNSMFYAEIDFLKSLSEV